MYANAVPGMVEKTKTALIQQNLNYQKDLNEVAPIVAQQLAGRQNEIGEGMAQVYASEFTEQELKDLVTFYKSPLVAWQPALGAEAYEVQWSKTRYPFAAELDPRTNAKGFMTASTSTVLPLAPGTWWYRVRGFDYSLPTGAQQMSWSDPARIVVSKPKFRVVKP